MRRSEGTARPGILSTNQSASDAILPNFHGGRGLWFRQSSEASEVCSDQFGLVVCEVKVEKCRTIGGTKSGCSQCEFNWQSVGSWSFGCSSSFSPICPGRGYPQSGKQKKTLKMETKKTTYNSKEMNQVKWKVKWWSQIFLPNWWRSR